MVINILTYVVNMCGHIHVCSHTLYSLSTFDTTREKVSLCCFNDHVHVGCHYSLKGTDGELLFSVLSLCALLKRRIKKYLFYLIVQHRTVICVATIRRLVVEHYLLTDLETVKPASTFYKI